MLSALLSTLATTSSLANTTISVGAKISTTGAAFVCWNIDASANRGFFWRNISTGNAYGAMLAKQASALAKPQKAGQSYLRFGGSGNDYLTYAFGGTPCPPPSEYTQCMNETQWRSLLSFAEAARARMIFGLSLNTGHDLEAGDPGFPFPWDPSNARQLLQWTIDAKLDHLIAGFELGNEQNTKYTADKMATNSAVLYNLTCELWPDASVRPPLFGPDAHSFHDGNSSSAKKLLSWVQGWMRGVASRGVPIAGVTHHEYIEVDPTADGFASPAKLELSSTVANAVAAAVRAVDPSVAIWAGEVGPHNGGSPVCDHTSMRWAVYGNSLWYADALGAKAAAGYTGFCRQDYIGADYGLVDCSTGAPLPDFFTALAFATAMGQTVLSASKTVETVAAAAPSGSRVRVYAHCTAGGELDAAGDGKGSVSVLVINLSDSPASLRFDTSTLAGGATRGYVLEPSADAAASITKQAGLLGTGVLLNGKPLSAAPDGTVEPLVPAKLGGADSVVQPAHSVGFYVFASAGRAECS